MTTHATKCMHGGATSIERPIRTVVLLGDLSAASQWRSYVRSHLAHSHLEILDGDTRWTSVAALEEKVSLFRSAQNVIRDSSIALWSCGPEVSSLEAIELGMLLMRQPETLSLVLHVATGADPNFRNNICTLAHAHPRLCAWAETLDEAIATVRRLAARI